MKQIAIIGAGLSSLAAACYLSKEGYRVSLYEKNETIGGRARQMKKEGFVFDMGPTFYWMPDVMERFFADFGKRPQDYYQLKKVDPGYSIYFGPGDRLSVSSDPQRLYALFEKQEPGSSLFLRRFLRSAAFNYKVAMEKVVYRPGLSPIELVMPQTTARIPQFVSSLGATVRRNIHSEKLRQILEFPVLFLGAKPSSTPSFYRFMNHADLVLGTWHIRGGMYGLVDALRRLAESHGARIHTGAPVEKIVTSGDGVTGILVNGAFIKADAVVSGADYHFTETLLERPQRNYSQKYWQKRTMAPSALLYYIAFDRKIDHITHHTLFFDADFTRHAELIYERPGWPERPLFYASFPSQTDPSMAPAGKEAAVVLVPLAAGLSDTPALREKYFDQIIRRMEECTAQSLRDDILFYESYACSDFVRDYHAYRGNAYGLANTLLQTAFLRPSLRNKKLNNLFYTGQLTVPGPGVPPALISGKLAAQQVKRYFNED